MADDLDGEALRKAIAANYTRTWTEQFELQKQEPIIWADQAFELFHASNILNVVYQAAAARDRADLDDAQAFLKRRRSMADVYERRLIKLVFYLRGLGLENLLKAILIANEQEPPPSHNLRRLAKKAGLTLTERQLVLLDALSANVIWYARYAVPLRQQDMVPRPGLRDFPAVPGAMDEREEKEVVALIDVVAEAYDTALRAFEPVRRKRSKAEWEKNQPGVPWPGDST